MELKPLLGTVWDTSYTYKRKITQKKYIEAMQI
jgi:hypothetical protein